MNKNNKYTELLKKQICEVQKENRSLEFKSNYQEADKLGQYISALSNGACLDHQDFAYLYFGIDDSTLEVKGTKFNPSLIVNLCFSLLLSILQFSFAPLCTTNFFLF